jgi:hypothetical protein
LLHGIVKYSKNSLNQNINTCFIVYETEKLN